MKNTFSLIIIVLGLVSIVYGIVIFIKYTGMPESSGLGVLAMQCKATVLVGVGLILFLTLFILKKKSIL